MRNQEIKDEFSFYSVSIVTVRPLVRQVNCMVDYCGNAFACDKASRRIRQHPYTV